MQDVWDDPTLQVNFNNYCSSQREIIVQNSFTPRELSRALHACTVMDTDTFLQKPITELTETAVSLLRLQQSFAKP